jgi:hypothetical protein
MCCGIVGSDLMVRVPIDEFDAVLRRHHVRPMDFTGKPLRGFVYVTPPGFRTSVALRAWLSYGERVAAEKAARPSKSRPTSHARSVTLGSSAGAPTTRQPTWSGHLSIRVFKCTDNAFALQALQLIAPQQWRGHGGIGPAAPASSRGRFDREPERAALPDDDGALNEVLQFANVARPAVGRRHLRLTDARHRTIEPPRALCNEVLYEASDVLATLPQRRDIERKHA